MRSEIKTGIVVGVVSIVVATVIGIAIVSSATSAAEAKYHSVLREHYIQEHLEPDELTIVRFGNSSTSQPLADGLMSFGATIYTYDNFEFPSYMPTEDTVYIFEDVIMREARDDPSLHEFLRNATTHHATIATVGDNPGILYEIIDEAGMKVSASNTIGPLSGYRISEEGAVSVTNSGPADSKDLALSVLKMVREEFSS